MLTLTSQNNNGIGRYYALHHLINHILGVCEMTKSIVTSFPHIKASKSSISNRKSIHGIGVNDSDYQTQPTVNGKRLACKIYNAWRNMITRCYGEKSLQRNPTYKGCTVDPTWYSFMSFRSWMIKQDWEDKQLDKDILIPGNKIYSPDTCVFVSCQINSLLTDRLAERGDYPMGVSWDKESQKFKAYININNRLKSLGRFNNAQEAHAVASKAKADHITNIAQTQPELIKSALLRHAKLFTDGCNEKIKPIT